MSNQITGGHEPTLIRSVVVAVRRMQGATHEVDRRAARKLGVNATDLAILGHLEAGPLTPKELARRVQITPASTTVAMRRLLEAGLITRKESTEDGRSQIVSLTPAAKASLAEIYGPIQRGGMELLAAMTSDELQTVLRFLEASADLQTSCADSIPDPASRPTD